MAMRGNHSTRVDLPIEESGDVGIVIKEMGAENDSSQSDDLNATDANRSQVSSNSPRDPVEVGRITSLQPPLEISLPRSEMTEIMGAAVNLPSGAAVSNLRQEMVSTGGQPRASGSPGDSPGAAFMGTRDQGSKIIFIIDASGSMASHHSMQVAKSALISSLQALDGNQQFLIIFYDEKPVALDLRDVHKPQLYAATEIHKTLARQKVGGIKPGAGTQHLPAIEMALRLRPDVIFLLTDGQEPQIYPSELEQLRQSNIQKTRIHTIEFGVGQEISEIVAPNNFLRKLARQNGGTYRYHDVTKFKSSFD